MQITWFYIVFMGYCLHVFAIAKEFSCSGRVAGYYADLASNCEQYHVCTGGKIQYTYSCPNTTRFLQQMMICDHAHRVDCSLSESYYSANLLLGQRGIPFLPQPNTESYDRVKKTKNSEFFTTQQKVKNLINKTTITSFPSTPNTLKYNNEEKPSSTTSYFVPTFSTTKPIKTSEHSTTLRSLPSTSSTFRYKIDENPPTTTHNFVPASSTTKPITTTENLSTFLTSTKRIKPVLENNEIKPLPGPPITLNELFEKLKRGSFDENDNEKKSKDDELTDKGRKMKLDWILPDVRAMFYIPDNEKDSVVPNIKRYSVVIPESKMVFKSKEVKTKHKECPSHCDPAFLNNESCSPCVMIK